MCMICVAIPATAAVDAKLNADQLSKPREHRKPLSSLPSLEFWPCYAGRNPNIMRNILET